MKTKEELEQIISEAKYTKMTQEEIEEAIANA